MTMRTLRWLANTSPNRSSPINQRADHRAIRTSMDPVEDYVWPELTLRTEGSEVHVAPVVLVTAPGAMGKSAAAVEVARETSGLYVDLAKMNVGSGTITGEVSKALGFTGADQFFAELGRGEVSLILDSTDEAQLRAGTENFIEFIRDLAWQLASARSAGQVLMFGRADSIDLTLLALDEVGIEPSVLEIAPLNFSASVDFIALNLDRKSRERATPSMHRTHSEPFERLRNRVFSDIMAALGNRLVEGQVADNWEPSRDFLGYPPVLDAIAERLFVTNPREELSAIEAERSPEQTKRGALLRTIVEKILDRESTKAQSGTGERLGIRTDDPLLKLLYSRDEQVARLLREVGVQGISIMHPAALDDNDRADYEKLVGNFIHDHPFIRGGQFGSEVFFDYVRAWAVSSPVSAAWIDDRSAFVSTLPAVGPFFAQFVSSLSAGRQADLPEAQLDDVVTSFKLGAREPRISILQRTDRGTLALVDGNAREILQFNLVDLSAVISLRGPLSRTTIISDMGVRLLPAPSGTIELGPDVVVVVEDLELEGSRLLVSGRDAVTGFSMLSAATATYPADLAITCHPRNALLADFPDAWHQWKPYLVARGRISTRLSREVAAQVVVAVRRILTSFRASISANPTVLAEKVDRLLVGRNEVFAATRDALVALGVLEQQGALYALNTSLLAEYHVSWNDLRGDDPARALEELCSAVANSSAFSSTGEGGRS